MGFKVPHQFRIQDSRLGFVQTSQNCPDNGAFLLPPKFSNRLLLTLASTGGGWEHVSISVRQGAKVLMPTWEECCYVKATFWEAEDCVVQFHPPASEYVNTHQSVLHLWRPRQASIPLPPSIFVGLKDVQLEKGDTSEQIQAKLRDSLRPEERQQLTDFLTQEAVAREAI